MTRLLLSFKLYERKITVNKINSFEPKRIMTRFLYGWFSRRGTDLEHRIVQLLPRREYSQPIRIN